MLRMCLQLLSAEGPKNYNSPFLKESVDYSVTKRIDSQFWYTNEVLSPSIKQTMVCYRKASHKLSTMMCTQFDPKVKRYLIHDIKRRSSQTDRVSVYCTVQRKACVRQDRSKRVRESVREETIKRLRLGVFRV